MAHGVTGPASVPVVPPTRTHAGQNHEQDPALILPLQMEAKTVKEETLKCRVVVVERVSIGFI